MERRNFVLNLAGLGFYSIAANFKVVGQTLQSTDNYTVEQFEDKGLAHYSYAIMAGKKVIVIDPQRNPQVYYDFAKKHDASIVGIIETHPHADFVSSHLEIHRSLNVPIYASSLTKSQYPLTAFDEGGIIKLTDKVGLRSMYTPGHAPDHIAAVLYEEKKDKIVFSGDSLFLGDVGRPDLLDYSRESEKQRKNLAEMMYDTVHQKFAKLDDDVIVYPSHGAGSLCGKSIRKAASSTIGYEKQNNYAFEKRTRAEFVTVLLSDQPFIPKYFSHDVRLNNQGAPAFKPSLANIKSFPKNVQPENGALLIDTRPSQLFQASYIKGAVNIPATGPMETWLGSLIAPQSKFYVIAADDKSLQTALSKAASIGYEGNILGTILYDASSGNQLASFDQNTFVADDNKYTYLDVRTEKEAKNQPVFKNSINIPLQDLDKRMSEIPTSKPILIHCGSGYRSATAASLLKKELPSAEIYDMGVAVTKFGVN
ncbi:MBL fold metallo-hydrolase [Dyadobacter psychrotolerans]|uniref:MBL fold metallo-hydrolase n=1 Tax=Dyadobacter psychrotolerans TaxID=2541721 RepID=A0A4R5DC09_9BACT|nr:MBL fold metallo-hydrolase [Dyadobacter psychrotolerans]TDE09351.1 MBL fold metallo-hydrolase [Dyadobacter psychrotolerans]